MIDRLPLYDRVAHETAGVVIRRYSTSFGLASKLLDGATRSHIENIYALVRLADEIVDGGAAEAGVDRQVARQLLDELEAETHTALERGYSTNLVVHAFATTGREVGIGPDLTAPFFASMRADLTETTHTPDSFAAYVYGSAEVVGLMCLRAFVLGCEYTPQQHERLIEGARRLGAAFQKVNFLRDLAADFETLGRSYFPGVDVESFDEATKNRLLDDIDDDLRAARETIPDLPAGCRRAVALAHGLFHELSRRLRRTPADRLIASRVRVPNPVKVRIAAAVSLGRLAAR
ncbi:phytoene/squalene synthase family protein [Herbiconiux sp. SYSU D00978]|uniref:phytoene/squalene synthase family protein n=1 Tax=Herbiconiux sp. SYSU D00978 TaxID=2812562 RepID=UPI001A96EB5A|nr:squalene/phytoene synthase family protein [Herbiconiux sp. SYSU D00978]